MVLSNIPIKINNVGKRKSKELNFFLHYRITIKLYIRWVSIYSMWPSIARLYGEHELNG